MAIFKKAEAEEYSRQLADVPVALIVPNPAQPRRSFDEESIRELAESIEKNGLIQPLAVQLRGGVYELIAGERRLRAVKRLGWNSVPCIIGAAVKDEELALKAVVENLQREDLQYFEEAECYAKLLCGMRITQDELASRVGKSQSYVANKLRLLRLEPDIRAGAAKAGLSERHARALLRLPEGELRREALEAMRTKQLSVKESERLVDRLLAQSGDKPRQRPKLIRIFRDYRLFINTVNAACDQLRESGLNVLVEQEDVENGVDITIRVSQA